MADTADENKLNSQSEIENIDKNISEVENVGSENDLVSEDKQKNSDSESKIMKFMKSIFPTVVIAAGSFLLVFLLHYFGAFNSLELQLYDLRLKLRGPLSGADSKSALPNAEGFIDLTEPFKDSNKNGTWDDREMFNDTNGNRKYDEGESYTDVGNGIWDEGENFVDLDGNGVYDDWDEFENWLEVTTSMSDLED